MIIDWSNLTNIIDPLLGNYKVCTSSGLRLIEKQRVLFSYEIAVHCDNWEKEDMKLYQETKYMKRVMKGLPRKTIAHRKIYKKKRMSEIKN